MRQTWRWFGPADLASIDDIVQAGAEGVVTALHHVPNGVVWTAEEIGKRQQQVRTRKDGSASGLEWDVIESLPVSEDIKKQKGNWRQHVEHYKQSLRHVAAAGHIARGQRGSDCDGHGTAGKDFDVHCGLLLQNALTMCDEAYVVSLKAVLS